MIRTKLIQLDKVRDDLKEYLRDNKLDPSVNYDLTLSELVRLYRVHEVYTGDGNISCHPMTFLILNELFEGHVKLEQSRRILKAAQELSANADDLDALDNAIAELIDIREENDLEAADHSRS